MTRPTRPAFVRSKGEVSKAEAIDTSDIEAHYRDILRGFWTVEGLPEGCPEGFLMDALWDSAGVGIKDVRGFGPVVLPASASTYDPYGVPVEWIPRPYGWSTVPDGTDFYSPSAAPLLWIRESLRERCAPYIEIMARALRGLGQNLTSLSHPILMSGSSTTCAGDNVDTLRLRDEIAGGESWIGIVKPEAIGLEVLDLHVTDNTQNLISVVMWCDSRILEMLGLSPGVEKSSGITSEETVSGMLPMASVDSWLLRAVNTWGSKVGVRMRRSDEVEEVTDDAGDSEDAGPGPEDPDEDSDDGA